MNYSTAIFLINDDVRGVACTYKKEDDAERYVFKTMDQDMAVGDYVVVPTSTRHGMTVVKVAAVDIDVDLESDIQLKWIIARLDLVDHDALLEQETAAINTIQSAQKRKKREELRAALVADAAAVKALPIANSKDD